MPDNKELQDINHKLDKLFDKLFEDNGGKCLQSRVNNNSLLIKMVVGVFSTIGAAIISMICWIVKGKLGA